MVLECSDVCITTYEQLKSAQSWFCGAMHWRLCVVDEAHRMKSDSSGVHAALKQVRCITHVLLTGTPVRFNSFVRLLK